MPKGKVAWHRARRGFWSTRTDLHTYTIDHTDRGAFITLCHYDSVGLAHRPPRLVSLDWTLRDAKAEAERDVEVNGAA